MRRAPALCLLIVCAVLAGVTGPRVALTVERPHGEEAELEAEGHELEREEHELEEHELEFSGRDEHASVAALRCDEPAGFAFGPVAHCAPEAVAAGSVSSKRFRFSRVLVGPSGDTEATIVFGPRNSALACSHGGFERPSAVWSSPDGGRTWRRSDPAPNPLVSGDCDMTVMDDGTWVVVFDTIVSATVATSEDRGKTWTVNPVTALPVGVDRPWILADGKRLLLGYADVQSNLPAVQLIATSMDKGRTWLDHRVVNTFDLPDRPNGVFGRPVMHRRTIRAPISMQNVVLGGPAWLYMVTSTDGGKTWKRTLVHDAYQTSVLFPSLSVAPNGSMYMGFATGARGAQDMTVAVLVSTNGGRSWKEITLAKHVAFPGPVAAVWVDARRDGGATAAWMANTSRGRQVWAARVSAKAVVVPAQGISPPVPDVSSFEFIMVDHDAQGRAHVIASFDTGDACHGPSLTGGRLRQCVYDFVER